MGDIKDITQKIKGKGNQVVGDARGGVKGGLQKLKGKLEEAEADIKLRTRHADDDTTEEI